MITETTRRRRELAYLLIKREQLIQELGMFGLGPQKAALQRRTVLTKQPFVLRILSAINDQIHRPARAVFHGA